MASHQPYLNNLTPLRGAAAIWVAVFHFKGNIPSFGEPHSTMLVEKGYMMVDLFFIMSGFIMRHVYGSTFSTGLSSPDLKRFFIARVARLYPLHVFTLFLLVAIVWRTGDWSIVNDPSAIPTNLLMLHSFGLHKAYTWNRHSWSLSAEWAAYIVFPFFSIFLFYWKQKASGILLVLIGTAYIALLYWLEPTGYANRDRLLLHKLDVTYDYGFLRGIAGFTLGMLCYGLYLQGWIRSIFNKDITAALCIVMTIWCMHKGASDLLLIVTFAGLTLSFAANKGLLTALCDLQPAQLVGKVSYSIYLIQGLVSMLFLAYIRIPPSGYLTGWLYMGLFLCTLVAVSCLTYYTIEAPCRNYINRQLMPRLA